MFAGLYFVIFTLFFLCFYAYTYEQSKFLQSHFKQINIFPIVKDSLKRSQARYEHNQLINTKKSLTDLRQKKITSDSINRIINYDGGQKGLIDFFNALYDVEKLNKGTCRIAYYGDSMIEGDLMSMTLREAYQKQYGGRGVGFIPIVSLTNKFRISVIHDYNASWRRESLLDISKLDFPLGISGEYFIAEANGSNNTVSFQAPNRSFVNTFPITKLFYGKSKTANPSNSLDFNGTSFSLNGQLAVNSLVLSQTPLKGVDLTFRTSDELPIYGISFESSSGVLVDNFALRGNSGIAMTALNQNILGQFNNDLGYDLIVLQFGLNVVSENTNYDWYKARMIRVVEHFKHSFPKASILLVSIPDISKKNDQGVMQTRTSVSYVIEAQKNAAMQTEVSFFNLYQAMGGEGSMVKWVEELKLANDDYIHFNFKGARNASNLIFSFLDKEYLKFKENDE